MISAWRGTVAAVIILTMNACSGAGETTAPATPSASATEGSITDIRACKDVDLAMTDAESALIEAELEVALAEGGSAARRDEAAKKMAAILEAALTKVDQARTKSHDQIVLNYVDKIREVLVRAAKEANARSLNAASVDLPKFVDEIRGYVKELDALCFPESSGPTPTCTAYQAIRLTHQALVELLGEGMSFKGGNEASFKTLLDKVKESIRLATDAALREALQAYLAELERVGGGYAAAGWDAAKLKELVAKEKPISQWPANLKMSQLCGIPVEPGLGG